MITLKEQYYCKQLLAVRERQVEIRCDALDAIDEMALALPDGFIWPSAMRKSYQKAVRILEG